MKYHTTIEEAKNKLLSESENDFTVLIRHGSMQVEYFAPNLIDTQKPHLQDELYVIASGESTFIRDGEIINCSKGEVLFVPAGMEHRFENFSPDFSTWVIFYGIAGGEASE